MYTVQMRVMVLQCLQYRQLAAVGFSQLSVLFFPFFGLCGAAVQILHRDAEGANTRLTHPARDLLNPLLVEILLM